MEPLARVVSGLGGTIGETYDLVDAARVSEIGIRNEGALRYEVSEEIWGKGVTIQQWVSEIVEKLAQIAAK